MNISNISAATLQSITTANADSKDVTKTTHRGNSLPVLMPITPSVEEIEDRNSKSRPSAEELSELIIEVNNAPQTRLNNLRFSVDEELDINVVRVEDAKTGELIRQIPSEEMLAVARALRENTQGTILEERV